MNIPLHVLDADTAPPLHELMPSIDSLIAEGSLFCIGHSGGKDSQAMMIKLLERVPREQLLVVHASLGKMEWEGALDLARQQAEDAGVPFIVATAVKTFFEMVEHRYAVRPGPNSSCWPSSANRQCTSDLKRGPIEREVRRHVKNNGFKTVVSCMGMRAAESHSRAKRPTFSLNHRQTIAGRTWYEWLPIHAMSTPEVFKTIADAGQQPHWAYSDGNDRLSCVFCLFGSEGDYANGAAHRPELADEIHAMEQRTGYTLHQSRRPIREIIRAGQLKRAKALAGEISPLAPSEVNRACG